jgi:hypothetical protein
MPDENVTIENTPAPTPGNEPAPAPATPPAPVASTPPGTEPAPTPAGDPPAEPAAPVGDPPADNKPADPPGWTARREAMIGAVPADMREKVSKVLGKYASEDAAVLALAAADSKISELGEKAKGLIKIPGKDAKPEEIAAYHKAIGVPEDAAKYEIKLDLPEGQTEPSELDAHFINEVAKPEFKKLGMTQAQVDGIAALEKKKIEMAQAEAMKLAEQASEKAQNHLRVAVGVKEYEPQREVINRYMVEDVAKYAPGGADELREGLSKRFADGSCLGDQVWFFKMVAPIANAWADDNNIPRGEMTAGIDLEARKSEIMGKMTTDPKEYERLQPELDAILSKLNRQQAAKNKAA